MVKLLVSPFLQYSRPKQLLLVLDSLAQRVPESELHKILQLLVYVASDGVKEDNFHASHQYLQPLDHGDDFYQCKLLLVGVVVAGCLVREGEEKTEVLRDLFFLRSRKNIIKKAEKSYVFPQKS